MAKNSVQQPKSSGCCETAVWLSKAKHRKRQLLGVESGRSGRWTVDSGRNGLNGRSGPSGQTSGKCGYLLTWYSTPPRRNVHWVHWVHWVHFVHCPLSTVHCPPSTIFPPATPRVLIALWRWLHPLQRLSADRRAPCGDTFPGPLVYWSD